MLKICKNCGRQFGPVHNNMRYCSEKCRKQHNSKRYCARSKEKTAVKPKMKKVCLICGKTFETGYPHKICCSPHCSTIHERERNRRYDRERYQSHKKTAKRKKPQKPCKESSSSKSLCWTCIHAVPNPEKGTGCSWSRSVGKIPVEGSKYQEKIISPCNGNGHDTKTLQIITKCPEYKRDMKVGRW